MTFATLRALHAVIGTAIDDVERVYQERSPGTPMEFPSLDEPYYHTAQHTPEEELAEALKSDPAVVTATVRIVAACAQLSTTVNKPWSGLMEELLWGQFASAIRFLEAAHIVEILREAGPAGLHVLDILHSVLDLRTNSKTAAPADEVPLTAAHLSHILRMLATGHYLREVNPDTFANNRASSYIDSGKTVAQLHEAPEKKYNDTDGVAAYVNLGGDECLKALSHLTEWALPEKRAPSLLNLQSRAAQPAAPALTPTENGIVIPQTRCIAAFNRGLNTQLGYFPWLELPENEGRLVRFGHAMVGTRQCEVENEILQGFSWDALPEGAVLVDVGGGIGSQSVLVAQAHPHIRVVVEDREQVVATAASAWGPQHAPLFASGRMSWRTRDFFEAWPALPDVEAPAVFFLRMILHDWNDADCMRILTQLRAAAGPDTKLLIGDMLLEHACADADDAADANTNCNANTNLNGTAKANGTANVNGTAARLKKLTLKEAKGSSPLLPNLGVGSVLGYFTDILMMGMFDAKERTVDEMTALTLSAGWKIVEIRRTPGSMWAYTTAVPM